MPPWHIDKTIGIQKFKNDRSLNDDQIETILRVGGRRRAEGRSEGHAARRRVWTDEIGLAAWRTSTAQPDLVVKSPDYTMPPVAQDAWWRPIVADGPHRAALGPRD